MNQTLPTSPNHIRGVARWSTGAFAMLATVALGGCGSTDSSAGIARMQQALEDPLASSCGYQVEAGLYASGKKGYQAWLEVTNVSGDPATEFSVFVDPHGTEILESYQADYEPTDGGYLFSAPAWLEYDPLQPGDSALLEFQGTNPYAGLTPYVISVNGVTCDTVAPEITLAASGTFFTADETLTLTAEATDDVAVRKVVFEQDGEVIAEDVEAPYTVEVPVSAAVNGRLVFTATAVDPTGNTAAASERVLVAIGNKFFGTAVGNAADYPALLTYFDQLTPDNAGKWGSVEATQNQMNWTDLDTAYTFAKTNGIPFKLHTLVWGQQQPSWIADLPVDKQLAEVKEWFGALAERYPDIDLIDVVNEPMHAPPSYAEALGGAGETGHDWVIKAFEMAREYFPDSELILNEYSLLQMASNATAFVDVVSLLQERGLIDGIGEQGHFYERAPEPSVLAANLDTLTATGLPIYISELDVNIADDACQAVRVSQIFPIFWENPSVVGVTHWGYRQGAMWRPDAWLLGVDGTPRASLTWLECYLDGGTDCPLAPCVPAPREGDDSGIALEAEEYDSAHDLIPAGNVVAYANNGSWFGFDTVVFDDNWNTLSVDYATGLEDGTSLEVRLDSLDNPPVATLSLPFTGSWGTMKTVSIPWAPLGGDHALFVVFGGPANVDKVEFSAPSGAGANIIENSDFELDDTSGWWSWGSGTIATTTDRAVSGARSLAMTERLGNSPMVHGLTVVPGETYKVSLWATIGGATSSVNVTTSLNCADGTGPGTTWMGGSQTVEDGTWVEFTGELQIPDCQLGWTALWLEGPGAGVDLYLDHISVRPVVSQNLVQNDTFESGTAGWFTWSGGELSATTARAHSGSQSLLVSNRDDNAPAATSLSGLVQADTNYPFSVWVSIDSPDDSSKDINVTRAASCVNAEGTTKTNYAWIVSPVTVADDGSWVELQGTLNVPRYPISDDPTCEFNGAITFYVEGGAGALLYVDDVQVLDSTAGSDNLIPDGTFESGQGAWGGWGFGSIAVVNTSAYSGDWSLMGQDSAGGALSRDILGFVTAGERYTATAWVSVGNLAEPGLVKWQTVQSCNGSGSDSYPWLNGVTVGNGEWVQVTGTVDLSECTSVEKLVLFAGADSGDLYLDDVTLTPLP